MDEVLLLDNITADDDEHGTDLRLYDSILSATGLDLFNFTPINLDRTPSSPSRKRRKIASTEDGNMTGHRFGCDVCPRTFPLKKTRDRHKESVHNKQQIFPCGLCPCVFTRKDIRKRHLEEKHNGKRRSSKVSITAVSESDLATHFQEGLTDLQNLYEETSLDQEAICRVSYHMDINVHSSTIFDSYSLEDDFDIDDEDQVQTHDCLGLLGFADVRPVNNPLLLCVNLLIRCKPFQRFDIHDKERDLVPLERPRVPNKGFWRLYGFALRTLSFRFATEPRDDPELLAAMDVFANVDVLISGSERMGHHAKAMYAMKAHHRARREPIFDALKLAFEHCGQTCDSIRIIYTKHGFVWMLNVRPRPLIQSMKQRLTIVADGIQMLDDSRRLRAVCLRRSLSVEFGQRPTGTAFSEGCTNAC